MMKIDVLSLFPEMFEGVLHSSIMKKAQDNDAVSFDVTDFRDYSADKHRKVDDYPYGGGAGMVLKPEPLFAAVEALSEGLEKPPRVILMCPQGERFTQKKAEELSGEEHLVFICGHYEGYDERIRQHLVTDELSIGDFVLTGGEIAAMAVIDSVVRLLPECARQCGIAGAGFVFDWLARTSALYATCQFQRVGSARCPIVRQSCGNRQMAGGTIASQDL